jgi:hypothetical protein
MTTFTNEQIIVATELKATARAIFKARKQRDFKAQDAALCRYNSLACAALIPCHWAEIIGW